MPSFLRSILRFSICFWCQSSTRCRTVRDVVNHTHSFLQSLYALKRSARLLSSADREQLTGSSLYTASYLLHSCSSTVCFARQLLDTGRAIRSWICCARDEKLAGAGLRRSGSGMYPYVSNFCLVSLFHGPLSPSPAEAMARTESSWVCGGQEDRAAVEDGMSRPKFPPGEVVDARATRCSVSPAGCHIATSFLRFHKFNKHNIDCQRA